MNKQILIVLGAFIILILVGGGVYAAMHASTNMSVKKTPVMTEAKPTVSTLKMTQGTLKSLLSIELPQKCTYSTDVKPSSVSGTVYVAKGKMRGDFVEGAGENKVNGHMIVENGSSYVWTDMSNQGFKMAINQMEPSVSPANTASQSPDLNQSVHYTCQGWTEDDSLLIPPANIIFSSFVMPSGAVTSPNANSSECSACNSVPEGPARTGCMMQLHCH